MIVGDFNEIQANYIKGLLVSSDVRRILKGTIPTENILDSAHELLPYHDLSYSKPYNPTPIDLTGFLNDPELLALTTGFLLAPGVLYEMILSRPVDSNDRVELIALPVLSLLRAFGDDVKVVVEDRGLKTRDHKVVTVIRVLFILT